MKSHFERVCVLVAEESISDAWRAMLELFGPAGHALRTQSSRGVSFDVLDLTLEVLRPDDSISVPEYRFPELVDDYIDRLFGQGGGDSLIAERLFHWRSGTDEIDQYSRIVELVRNRPEARSAVFSLWRPESDNESAFPMSPIAGCFRVRDSSLFLSVVARSLDVWLGAVPEMIALARLQREVAGEAGLKRGSLVLHVWSAHIYEEDLILARKEGAVQ